MGNVFNEVAIGVFIYVAGGLTLNAAMLIVANLRKRKERPPTKDDRS